MKYRIAAAALACTVALAACGGGGSSGPGTPVTPGATASPSPSPTPAGGLALHTVAAWRGATHSTTASSTATAGTEPVELGVPNSVSAPVAASSATLQAYAADANGNPVATSGAVTVSVANGALATVQSLAVTQTPAAPADVATISAAGAAGTTTVTVALAGASPVTLPVVVYASLGVESTPSRDGAYAWSLQNGVLAPASAIGSSDVSVITARTSQTTFNFPYGYQRFPVATPFGSILNATAFVSAGTLIAASDIAASPSAYGTIVFKTANGEYVKARVVGGLCLGADTSLCDGGATLDAIALPSAGGVFPY